MMATLLKFMDEVSEFATKVEKLIIQIATIILFAIGVS